jgi:hypothetical protein
MGIRDRYARNSQLVALADGMGWLPQGLRTRGSPIGRAAREVRDRLQEVTAAQSQLTFARISGRSTIDAAARLSAAMSAFNDAAEKLLELTPPAPSRPGMRNALNNLKSAIDKGGERGDAWAQAVSVALDAVERAVVNSQIQSDEDLYNKDAGVRAACEEIRGLSRLGLAEESVVHPGSGVLAALPREVPVYGFAVGASVKPVALKDAANQPVRRLNLDTESAGTELSQAVREALDRLRGVPVQAVVLLSDGRQPAPAKGGQVDATAAGVPVYTVGVAPNRPVLSDLSLSQISVPTGVHLGEPFVVKAKVHGTGVAAGRAVEVRCTVGAPGAPPMALAPGDGIKVAVAASAEVVLEPPAKRVTLGNDEWAEATFELTIDQPGPRRVTLSIPDTKEEITAENNVAERWIKVYPRRSKVLLLADAPTWDFRFVRDALRNAGGFDVRSDVLYGGSLSVSRDELLTYDAAILFDVAADSLDARQWESLRDMAASRGGLLVMQAGVEHFPGEYDEPNLARWVPAGAGATTQPSTMTWRTWEGAAGVFQFAPPRGDSTLHLADRPAMEGEAWAALPPLYHYLPLPPLKPGAVSLLTEARTRQPLVAVQPIGAGNGAFIGIDQTWRWRTGSANSPQERFWMQLITSYAEAPYAAASDRLWLDVGRAGVHPGEPIRVRVKSFDEKHAPASSGTVSIRALRDGQTVQSLETAVGPAGRVSATLAGLPAGNYVIEAAAPGAPPLQYPIRVVGQYEEELENPAGDRESLARMSSASGGEAFSLEDVRELPRKLDAVLREPRPVSVPLWDSTYLFAFVVGCLALEWALRKRMGLA